MTRVLFTCQFSVGYGGVQHSMLDIINHLDRTRFKPIVLCAPEGEVPTLAAAAQAEVHTVGRGNYFCYSHKRPLDTLRDLFLVTREIVRLARAERVNIVHTFDGMVFLAACLAQVYLGNLKVIWLDSGFNIYPRHFRVVMRWCFKHAACVATITQVRWAQLLAEGLNPARSAVVTCGTDFHTQIVPAERTDGRLRIGIIGRITPIKNYELFLRVARLVADRHPEVEFVVVGSKGLFADELAYYQSIVELTEALGLTEQVSFHSPKPELAPVLKTFDILVCTSHLETFGRVLIEAMALSKPVVATAVGGIPEVVTDGEVGYLVAPGDAAAMAEKLCSLIEDNELRAELGRKGHERVLQHYDIRTLTRQWEEIYDGLLKTETPDEWDYREASQLPVDELALTK